MTTTDEVLAELDQQAEEFESVDQDASVERRAIEHIRSLTGRLEKVEKDAERYRWLRRSDEGVGDELRIALLHEYGDEFLDEAIDAAIAQEGADHE